MVRFANVYLYQGFPALAFMQFHMWNCSALDDFFSLGGTNKKEEETPG